MIELLRQRRSIRKYLFYPLFLYEPARVISKQEVYLTCVYNKFDKTHDIVYFKPHDKKPKKEASRTTDSIIW